MTRYGVPYWLARVPVGKRPRYPRHRGPLRADVAVVGAGLTGVAAAYLLASSGIHVIVLEADRVGQGASAGAMGVVRFDPAPPFHALEARYGRRAARAMWKASRRAGADLVSTLKRLGVRCDPIERDGIDLALTAEQAEHLRCEYGARQQAGLEGAWLGEGKLLGEVGVGAAGGIRSAGWMLIDPYRACLGLASAAVKRGADIFERSPVTAIEPARLGSEIRTDKGTVSVKTAIVATGAPTAAFKPLARHFNRTVTYAALTPSLEPTLRRQLGRREAVVRDSAAPAHQVTWTADHRMLATGADQVVPSARKRDRALVQRGGQLMYETSLLYPAISGILPDYVWEVAIAETVDGMIYAGPHRNYPHHLFAFGAGHNGPAAAFLAARILVRCCLEAPEPDDALFGFSR